MPFPTTQWNIVDTLKVKDVDVRREALGDIVNIYGPPLLAFAFRQSDGTRTREDCEDVLNDFFVRCIEGGLLEHADRARGKFRSFLVTSFKYYMSNENRAKRTQKRRPTGGLVSLDALREEFGPALEPRTDETAEAAFHRVFRCSLFKSALAAFQKRCRADHREINFQLFMLREVNPKRDGTPVPSYRSLATSLHVSSDNLANKIVLAATEEFRSLLFAKVANDCISQKEAQLECDLIFAGAGCL
jgi:RNA polymerase sigma-70 factor (ECF subfamily)